jgi:acetate kinase
LDFFAFFTKRITKIGVTRLLILSINTGSSSIKYTLIEIETEQVLIRGIVENIGASDARMKHCLRGKEEVFHGEYSDHEQSIQAIINILLDTRHGALHDLSEVFAVGHRIAHGGEAMFHPTIIDESTLAKMRENIRLAPLHMPHMVRGIEAFEKLMPDTPMVAVFDTAFHQTMPPEAYLYAIPYEYYLKYGIRRYGFHGTSHKYVSERAAKFLNQPLDQLKTITCHLGNGSSIAAVRHGSSIDTSMGFTPLSGVPMGTRCGDIDPAIVGRIMEYEDLTYPQVEKILTNQSGLQGLSGISNDCREIEIQAMNGNRMANMAIDVLCYQVKKYIGAYIAAMNGLNCLVFTGGIGENGSIIRERICTGMEYLGIHLDCNRNAIRLHRDQDAKLISADGAPVRICVIRTNEELMIAKQTYEAIRNKDDSFTPPTIRADEVI